MLQDSVSLYRQKPEKHVWKWVLRNGRNVTLDKTEVIDMGAGSQDTGLNAPA